MNKPLPGDPRGGLYYSGQVHPGTEKYSTT